MRQPSEDQSGVKAAAGTAGDRGSGIEDRNGHGRRAADAQ
jgi:hypothetical protein